MTRLHADWLRTPEVQSVCAALTEGGQRALFVGGCVRNTLLGEPVSDIDIATDAPPETIMELAGAAGLKAVPTGVDHGTVTLVAGGRPFEVTTFRRDVETDGRRAVVAFSDRVEEDAARRDFTMNAIYAAPDGTLIDPIGGLPDLHARRLRFIGAPSERIAEDYLRILRFFRFYAWYADPAQGPDPEALAACAANVDGLDRVSAERIGHEMRKLLAARDPAPAVATMARAGVLAHVLPGADASALAVLVHLEDTHGTGPEAIRRLAALGGDGAESRLRLSRSEARRLALLRDGLASAAAPAEIAWRDGADTARDVALLRAALTGTSPRPDLETEIRRGEEAEFPVSASDLMPGLQGPALGARLKALESEWIASGFALDRAALLALPFDDG